ncbi:Hsp20/alpha crystallin family protein [Halobacteriovorax sp. JY17]|uniref:Hsp20/alpha crystallin family protein n=1 Tax=Halobacteriovorax sp. JY17 TaxID=2014617 RepID=UPI000C617E29|nr:Hsp20/alpha crystallin family protein [Halobacteriovorax sp. JY17]PIK15895.1 MAG: hypothetical protein CES88_03985 [Halobacteriovorax sp. JY17]
MKLDSELQFSKSQLEKLNDSQRKLVSSRQREIEKIDHMYEEKKADERYNGEAELLDIRDRNQTEIAEQLVQKQERLSNIKTSFDDSKKKLDQEKEILSASHQEKIEDLNSVYDNKYRTTFDDASILAEEIDSKTHDTLRNLENEADERILHSTFTSKLRSDEKNIENARKLADQEKVHQVQQKTATKSYERKTAESMMEHEKMLQEQNFKQLSQRKDLEVIHNSEIKSKDEQHKDLLIQEDKSFKQKYAAITKEHQSVLDRIKEKFGQQLNTLINGQMKSKANIENKNDDEFYKITSLEPQVANLEKSYQISLHVPEYEKENVRLTAQGRDLSLSLTRKFSDSVVSEDGSKNQSNRSEVFTKKISTEDLLNSREITQSYNEGVLTFNIAKL